MAPGFPPLGERRGLLPGRLSPALVQLAVRFGTQLPFGKAAELLNLACGTAITHDTVRRLTERAGAVWRHLELADAASLVADGASDPAAVSGLDRDPIASAPDVLLSLDGAMVPLVGGEWTEARTLVLGAITPTPTGPTATSLSSVSRLCPAAAFGSSVYGELVRRAVLERPGAVVAVSDGAVWIQELLDLPCPEAVRVLDLMHAVEYLAAAAKVAFGPGTEATSDWLAARRTELKTGAVSRALMALADLPASDEREAALRYLTARIAMRAYDRFVAAGWPIGSGAVESANKVVVEARLKGAGMHWRREHADAVVGLRALDASARSEDAWPRIVEAWRSSPRRRQRQPAPPAVPGPPTQPVIPFDPAVPAVPAAPASAPPPSRPKTIVDGKPTADHPWKRGLRPPRPDAPPIPRESASHPHPTSRQPS